MRSSEFELGANKARANNLLKVLTSNVQDAPKHAHNLGLYGGLAGELLFLWQAGKYDDCLVNEVAFGSKLDYLQEHLHLAAERCDLSRGLAGLGWFLEFVNQNQDHDYEPSFCAEIDEIVQTQVSVKKWRGEIEVVSGLGGLAAYGARRCMKVDMSAYYSAILAHYGELATRFKDHRLAWCQPKRSVYRLDKDDLDRPEFNLGLAHGVVGIIAAIVPALKIPALSAHAEALLRQSCDWLLDQRLNTPRQTSFFPVTNNVARPSRLGWCYGDLTIALTLARVGKALGKTSYLKTATEICLHSTSRDQIDGQVYDVGLCHGSAGIALIFQMLHKELMLDELQHASLKWLDFTLNRFDCHGETGLHKYSNIDNAYYRDTGLLEGYSGVGLSLLSAASNDTSWTDCLMLS